MGLVRATCLSAATLLATHTASAHDPFETTTDVELGQEGLSVTLTMARTTALELAEANDGEPSGRLLERCEALGSRLWEVTSAGRPLDLLSVAVTGARDAAASDSQLREAAWPGDKVDDEASECSRARRLDDRLGRSRLLLPVTFSFGMIHGLGLASAFGSPGAGSQLSALGFAPFDVGVEAAQIAAAALVVPALRSARRWQHGDRSVAWAANAIGAFGLGLFVWRCASLP